MLDGLSAADLRNIEGAFHAATDGPFFPEWEFQTLFGWTRDEVRDAGTRWQNSTGGKDDVQVVISVLGHLLGYPHRMDAQLRDFVPAGADALRSTLDRLRQLVRGV